MYLTKKFRIHFDSLGYRTGLLVDRSENYSLQLHNKAEKDLPCVTTYEPLCAAFPQSWDRYQPQQNSGQLEPFAETNLGVPKAKMHRLKRLTPRSKKEQDKAVTSPHYTPPRNAGRGYGFTGTFSGLQNFFKHPGTITFW
jgi:hypothetical protein